MSTEDARVAFSVRRAGIKNLASFINNYAQGNLTSPKNATEHRRIVDDFLAIVMQNFDVVNTSIDILRLQNVENDTANVSVVSRGGKTKIFASPYNSGNYVNPNRREKYMETVYEYLSLNKVELDRIILNIQFAAVGNIPTKNIRLEIPAGGFFPELIQFYKVRADVDAANEKQCSALIPTIDALIKKYKNAKGHEYQIRHFPQVVSELEKMRDGCSQTEEPKSVLKKRIPKKTVTIKSKKTTKTIMSARKVIGQYETKKVAKLLSVSNPIKKSTKTTRTKSVTKTPRASRGGSSRLFIFKN